jgi:hypothetical protein
MNLLLLCDGYPPVAVRPEDRKLSLDTLAYASVRDDIGPFQTFMHEQPDATLTDYVHALHDALPPETTQ